jgi:hypothetical protein
LISWLLIFQALLELLADAFSYLSQPSRRVPVKLAGNSLGDVSSRIAAQQVVVEKVIFNCI